MPGRRSRRRGEQKGWHREAGRTPVVEVRRRGEAVLDGRSGSASPEAADRDVPGARVAVDAAVEEERLVRLAEGLELGEVAIGELVYDMLHRDASGAYNGGAYEDLDDIEAFEAVHDEADAKASEINNLGLEAQIGALVAAWGPAEVERALRGAAEH